MKCMNVECSNELTGRQKTYCSDKCRMAQSRTAKVEQTKPEQANPNSITLTESDTLSSMALPNGTTSHYAVDVTLTTTDIVAMSNDEAIALLSSWLQGKGTAYQYRVAVLAYKYSNRYGMANMWSIDSAALADSPEDAQD